MRGREGGRSDRGREGGKEGEVREGGRKERGRERAQSWCYFGGTSILTETQVCVVAMQWSSGGREKKRNGGIAE